MVVLSMNFYSGFSTEELRKLMVKALKQSERERTMPVLYKATVRKIKAISEELERRRAK